MNIFDGPEAVEIEISSRYDAVGTVIETHEHSGEFCEP